MVRKKEAMRVRPVEHVQGAGGRSPSTTAAAGVGPGPCAGFQLAGDPPGASIGYHEHQVEFEAYVVLSGEATERQR